ncbi:cobalamin biosynthesis protein [Alphaproteobacteria bacterium]|nr:cobalamin biosynthesis protein [Alphaproteobacteria bacterium]
MLESFISLHEQIISPDRLPIAAAAIILSIILGIVMGNIPLGGNANPVAWQMIDTIFGTLGNRLDRKDRKRGDLIFRGFIMTTLAILLAYGLAQQGSDYAKSNDYGMIYETLMLSLCLTCGGVWHLLIKLYRTIESGKSEQGAYAALTRTTRTNLTATDSFGITRVGMNYAARSFDKSLVSPIFWFLILGLPGAFIYTALAAMAWRFGKDGFTKGFGASALALEKLMGFIPSFLAGTLIMLASTIAPTASITRSLSFLIGFALCKIRRGVATYDSGGMPLSAMAWALDVTLGGASKDIEGSAIKSTWTGPPTATAKIDHTHLRRAILIHMGATLLFLAALGGAYLWSELLLDIS